MKPIAYTTHWRALALLGVPIVIGQLGTIAQSFADTMMVGQYGTDELSASGFVNNVFNLAIFFLVGFSYSTTPVVGRYYGQGRSDCCGRALRESLIVNASAFAGIAVFMLTLYACLPWLGQPTALLPLIRPYFLIILASLLPMALFNAMKQFSDGVGDTRTPMWIMIGGNVTNVLLNWLLIYGLPALHIPQMGLNGAGWATLASRLLMTVVLGTVVLCSRRFAPYRTGLQPTRRGMSHLVRKGLPISMQMALESSSFNIAAIMMGWLGTTALAAHQVMCTVGSLCFMFYYGVGAAAAVRMSHFRGRGQTSELPRIATAAYLLCLASAVVLTGSIILFAPPLISCFTTSADVVAMVLTLLLPFAVYQLGDSLQVVYANALRAVEDVKPLFGYAAVAYLVVSVPLSFLFGFILKGGAAGIWWAFPFGLSTAGLLFLRRFRRSA